MFFISGHNWDCGLVSATYYNNHICHFFFSVCHVRHFTEFHVLKDPVKTLSGQWRNRSPLSQKRSVKTQVGVRSLFKIILSEFVPFSQHLAFFVILYSCPVVMEIVLTDTSFGTQRWPPGYQHGLVSIWQSLTPSQQISVAPWRILTITCRNRDMIPRWHPTCKTILFQLSVRELTEPGLLRWDMSSWAWAFALHDVDTKQCLF